MQKLEISDALFVEADFPRFNQKGFRRVKEAIELAQQKKALATDAIEIKAAAEALRAAADKRDTEQRLANKFFEIERNQTFTALSEAFERIPLRSMNGEQRRKVEQMFDHLATLYRQKEFGAIREKLKKLTKNVEATVGYRPASRFAPPFRDTPTNRDSHGERTAWRSDREPKSITALFRSGLELERNGRVREAAEIYRQVLERNPNHLQAKNKLEAMTERHGYRRY